MKKIISTAAAFFAVAIASAQSTRPTTPVTAPTTGTENITGAAATTRVAPQKEPDSKNATTVGSATTSAGKTEPVTNYGTNNDGSSTGTTVTGNGGANSTTTVNAEPGKMVAVPRGK